MRNYGQYCPIARTSEILAERWTPIIVRNLLLGCTTFGDIAAGTPGISRGLLSRRLRELERAAVIEIRPKPDGHGSVYELTQAGRDLWPVLQAMRGWGMKWLEVTPAHSHPDVVLWSWSTIYLRDDLLPEGRVVVRFDFPDQPTSWRRFWLLVEDGNAELCRKHPGFEEDVQVVADSLVFARWHLGEVEWADALRSGEIHVTGPRKLARALPTWNRRAAVPRVHTNASPAAIERDPSQTGRSAEIAGFKGWVVTSDDDIYDAARAVWNGAIDRRPKFIARCVDAADVVAALRFGRERELPIAVRGGGHSVAGTAVCDNGLVIDLSAMKGIQVDPADRSAQAEAGVLWGELDGATQVFGLATTGGVVSHTGIAGLTLGGGIGWLMRRHGLTIDNLLSAQIITANGEVIAASDQEHPDLFWGLRGGGGNFGIVTSFEYRLHPVGPEVLAGPVLWAMEGAEEVLRHYREFAAQAPRELNSVVNLRRAPDFPVLPNELHGRPVCMITVMHLGDPEAGERVLEPLRNFGRPLLDLVGARPYSGLQSLIDATVPHGWHYYWKSAELGPLDDGVIDAMVEHSLEIRSPRSFSAVFQLGGAVADADEDATAYSNRDAAHNININAAWLPGEPVADEEIAWARDFFAALEPYQSGAYVNFLDRDDEDRVKIAYGADKYRRLVELKNHYDPDNVFRMNQNIRPSGNRKPERAPETSVGD
ncbi:MAG: FAD-binding protein [Actinobacteria bacterium]|nr:FAD-binding protein [Actinomycetota bacterium]